MQAGSVDTSLGVGCFNYDFIKNHPRLVKISVVAVAILAALPLVVGGAFASIACYYSLYECGSTAFAVAWSFLALFAALDLAYACQTTRTAFSKISAILSQ